ncbi:MAG: hypothetical protein HYU28_11725, partial [Actinobacteria bacterium]|nr:hypothetical protein [Actinomycetota bacterium]
AVVHHDEPLAAREPSPAFQELPGDPITGAAAPEPAGKGSSRIPLILALVAGATLALSFAVLLVADVQRRMRAFRARREARLRHPTGSAEPSALLSAAPLENQPEPEPEPEQEGSEPETSRTPIEGPTWHNEPEWLSDLFPDEPDEPRNPRP